MKEKEKTAGQDGKISFERDILELLHEHIVFAESVFARMPMSIEIYDTNGLLRCMNERAQNMYGVNWGDVKDKINLLDSPYIDDVLEKKIKAGEDITLEFEYDFDLMNKEYFATRNQKTIIYEANVVPIMKEQGFIVGYMLLTNDVTATKEAEYRTEESKKNLEMAMEAASMSSWVYDVNKQVFGSLHGDPIVRDVMTLEELQSMLHPHDRAPLTELFSTLINKEILQGQITVRAFNGEDGDFKHYESTMRLSTEHLGKLLIVGTQLDVTEKIKMAKKLRTFS